MRLLKTHSHTSERLGYEVDKKRQLKGERKGAHPKRRENVNGNHRRNRGGGGDYPGGGHSRRGGGTATPRVARTTRVRPDQAAAAPPRKAIGSPMSL